MIDEFIENVESYLRLNAIGDMSDRMTVNYVRMSLKIYNKQKKLQPKRKTHDEVQARNAIATYYGGTNIND